uniref:Uncharacterized protein n=1 Tax=Physcomitrium patens TaxID=3218 RepID=A0A2K1K249_PHYPA|nr:hypothetical protein PHYPA_012324 [Physcomitrium patens]
MAAEELPTSDIFFTPLGSPTTILKVLAAWNLESRENSSNINTRHASSFLISLRQETTNKQSSSINVSILRGSAHHTSIAAVGALRLMTLVEVSMHHSLGTRSQPFARSIIVYLLSGSLCLHLHQVSKTTPTQEKRPTTSP